MNRTVILIISMAAALLVNIAKKVYAQKSGGRISDAFVYNALNGLLAAVILLCWGGISAVSVFTAVLGVVFGAVTALQGIANITALKCGPMSYTSVIISFSTLISALSGALFFSEKLGAAQIIGIVLMLVSFVMATEPKAEEKRANMKWLLLCLIAFAATGGIGIMQKVHQSSVYREELNAFLVIAFVSSASICTVLALLLKKRERKTQAETESGSRVGKSLGFLLGIMLISGVCTAVNHKLNLYLSGVMDSAVFFPIVNGGGLVLTTLAALLFFREKLSRRQWIGVAFGIASVVFLCNPFR